MYKLAPNFTLNRPFLDMAEFPSSGDLRLAVSKAGILFHVKYWLQGLFVSLLNSDCYFPLHHST